MKREVIFPAPDNDEYRVVCRFGYDSIVTWAWYGHLQRRISFKKWIFFGETKSIWTEVTRCWWNKTIDSMDELEDRALDLYDETIALPIRLKEKAMNLK